VALAVVQPGKDDVLEAEPALVAPVLGVQESQALVDGEGILGRHDLAPFLGEGVVQADGKVVDGRMMNVTDFGEGGLSVTVSENGMYGNLMFNSEAIELDTIGKIVAGIEF
jgi:hypothetical protein